MKPLRQNRRGEYCHDLVPIFHFFRNVNENIYRPSFDICISILRTTIIGACGPTNIAQRVFWSNLFHQSVAKCHSLHFIRPRRNWKQEAFCNCLVELIAFAFSWWRHQIETFSALLAICAGNSPVTDEFATQRPATRSFDVFFDLRLNKRLRKQSWGWWFETLSRPLWRHRNVYRKIYMRSHIWSLCLPFHSTTVLPIVLKTKPNVTLDDVFFMPLVDMCKYKEISINGMWNCVI